MLSSSGIGKPELGLFTERLDEGAHLLLTAPRRMGKTSLMKEAARRLSERYVCLYVDLEKAASPADAIVELSLAVRPYAGLWDKAKSLFKNVLGEIESIQIDELSVKLRSGLDSGNWQAKGDHLFDLLATHDKGVVLMLDEVPILVNRLLKGPDFRITPERRQAAVAFLSWLRANSIRHQGKVRIVVSGSIGLEPIVRQAGLSATLNTLTPFGIEPWSPDVAAGCLRALACGYSLAFPQEAVSEVLDRLGSFVPAHVQMFFDYIYQECRLQGVAEVSTELVAYVYNHSMLGTRGHVELSHMEERLEVVLGTNLYVLALDLLTETAITGHLTPEAARILARLASPDGWEGSLRDVLEILQHDGYLGRDGGEFRFVSRLLRDWWRRRFELTYVPVSKREGRHVPITD